MKIMVMTSLYPPYYRGGAELGCQSHVEVLQARNHLVHVLTSRWGIIKPAIEGNVFRMLNYDTAGVSLDQKIRLHDPLRLRRRYDQLKRTLYLGKNYNIARDVLMVTQPEVVYVWQMQDVSLNPVLAAQDLGIPTVIRLSDYWLAQLRTELCLEPNPLKRWYRRVFGGFGSFDRLVTRHMLPLSGAVTRMHLEAGFLAESMQVIPECVPSEQILKSNELATLPSYGHSGAVRLLFAGRLVSEKAPDTAIESLAHLVAKLDVRQAKLDIIGEGPREYERQLRDMVTSLGLEKKVSFLGKIDQTQLLARYSDYDILLFPSRWVEPFGKSVIEAMARGLPVVATNHGGPAEVIVDGENGLLIPPNNPSAMAEAIKTLVINPELVQRIRWNALETIRAKYCLESRVEQVESHLQEAIIQNA